MRDSYLIIAALLLGITVIGGWAYEVPLVDQTIGAGQLIYDGALVGLGVGFVAGIGLAWRAPRAIGKFQAFATSLILGAVTFSLLAHGSNRLLGDPTPDEIQLQVKEVRKVWSGRGLSRDAFDAEPDGYYVFVETTDGLVRLQQSGGAKPQVGPTRTVDVLRYPGYWGYPRYEMPAPVQTAASLPAEG